MMTIAELLAHAAAQPVVTVNREISVPGPTLQVAMQSRPYMTVAELIAHPDQHKETRLFRYGHVLGPGLSRAAIAAWQNAFPTYPLPADVAEALESVNGIHLWADLAVGRSYFGIAPLDEWQGLASLGRTIPRGTDKALAISYHENGDFVVALNVDTGRYDRLDHEDIDNPVTVARTFAELVQWYWEYTRSLDPSRKPAG